MIDLHTHSIFSDGQRTPEELIHEAVATGLSAIALTDHDTIAGWDRFEAAGAQAGIRAVRGVEVSVDHPEGPIHLLAYLLGRPLAELRAMLARLQQGRDERNRRIAARLAALGVLLSLDEVRAIGTEGGQLGRVHFARALVARGYAATTQEAFDRWLARGRPAYCERFRFAAPHVIQTIHRSGGLAVLAHPGLLPLGRHRLERVIRDLVRAGLDGIETIHPRHSADQVAHLTALAARYQVVATGGTDFHGSDADGTVLRGTVGAVQVPDAVLDALTQRLDRLHAGHTEL